MRDWQLLIFFFFFFLSEEKEAELKQKYIYSKC